LQYVRTGDSDPPLSCGWITNHLMGMLQSDVNSANVIAYDGALGVPTQMQLNE
jgi:hypothetical protein